MEDNRGIKFLTGLAGLYGLWLLRDSGLFEYLYGRIFPANASGAGAIIFSIISDLIVALGGVMILVVSGLWGVLREGLIGVQDFLNSAKNSLEELQKKLPEAEASGPPTLPKPVLGALSVSDQVRVLAVAIQDTRSSVLQMQTIVETLAGKAGVPVPKRDSRPITSVALPAGYHEALKAAGFGTVQDAKDHYLRNSTFEDLAGLVASDNPPLIAALGIEVHHVQ